MIKGLLLLPPPSLLLRRETRAFLGYTGVLIRYLTRNEGNRRNKRERERNERVWGLLELGPIGPSSLGPSFSQILLSLSLEENIVAPLRYTRKFRAGGQIQIRTETFL